jgi:hypothetical protein
MVSCARLFVVEDDGGSVLGGAGRRRLTIREVLDPVVPLSGRAQETGREEGASPAISGEAPFPLGRENPYSAFWHKSLTWLGNFQNTDG